MSAWIFLIVLLAGTLCAQKAKPIRIALKDGAATVEGRLRGRQQTDYEIGEVAASKILTLQVTSTPAQTVALKLYTPESAEMPLRAAGTNGWTAELSKSGDYGISVLRTALDRGTSTYRLTIRIR